MKRVLLLTYLILPIISHAQSMTTVTSDSVIYIDGNKCLLAYSDNNIAMGVEIKDTKTFDKHLVATILIVNKSDNPVTFSPEKITAIVVDKRGKQKDCTVYTSEEWLRKEQNSIFWWGPDNVQNVTTESEVVTKDSYGNTVAKTKGKVTEQVYTGAKTKAMREAKERIDRTYFKKSTISVGEQKRGNVIFRNSKANNLIITIPLDNRNFVFDLSKE